VRRTALAPALVAEVENAATSANDALRIVATSRITNSRVNASICA
jgi:hypothetical protein